MITTDTRNWYEVSKVAPRVKMLATKPNDMSSSPKTYEFIGLTITSFSLTPTHTHTHILAQTEEGHGLHCTPFPILPRSATVLEHTSLLSPTPAGLLILTLLTVGSSLIQRAPIWISKSMTSLVLSQPNYPSASAPLLPTRPSAACCFLECWSSFLTHGLLFSTHALLSHAYCSAPAATTKSGRYTLCSFSQFNGVAKHSDPSCVHG